MARRAPLKVPANVRPPTSALTARNALVPWMQPELTGINRLPGRATILPFSTAADALADRGAHRLSLDGTWRFKVVGRVEDTPDDFPTVDVTSKTGGDKEWGDIAVPGNWTMQGYGQPHYTNWHMPFSPSVPPTVPVANPTGLYRTSFTLPKTWLADRRLVLQFGGVETCFSVWLNGVAVGLGKDSRLPSEFDITAMAKAGVNQLAVQVITWADSSYLEDQDHWRQAGIHRSVTVIATAPAWIEDVFARGGYDHVSGAGDLAVTVRGGLIPSAGWKARVQVHDAGGKALFKTPLESELPFDLKCHNSRIEGLVTISAVVPKVSPWSNESPTLYTVITSLIDPAGHEVEATRTRLGFRSITIADRELRINGKMVYIRGANRHDHHDRLGKAVDRTLMLRDIQVLKEHHFNAVRCSHYPNDPQWLDLCDEHGIYLIDETDLECHHHFNGLPNDPRFALAFLDRGMRMVLRDRNHPSVIAWSLGNESGYGPNHDAMAGWMRHADPTRIIHYEGAICRVFNSQGGGRATVGGDQWDKGHAATDLLCPMYPSINDLIEHVRESRDPRPLIMCEYNHAMGNSLGSFADYWAAIESHHGLQGGFIWELLDHGIAAVRRNGAFHVVKPGEKREVWAYGGDFGDTPNDTNFCCDGLLWPDRTPHTAMAECKKVFQPVRVIAGNLANREVSIRNWYDFTDLSHLRGSWELTVDGSVVERGALAPLALAPGQSQTVQIPYTVPQTLPGQELHLTVRFHAKSATAFLPKDYEMAWDQFAVPAEVMAAPARPSASARSRPTGSTGLTVRDGTRELVITGEQLELIIAKDTGRISAWRVAGRELLLAGPQLTAWRAPIDNDGVKAWDMVIKKDGQKPLTKWMNAGLNVLQRSCAKLVATEQPDGTVLISSELSAWGSDRSLPLGESRRLVVRADGSLAFNHVFTVAKGLPDLPRLGVELEIPEGFEHLEFFGHGPHESYNDRLAGAAVGRYATTVTDRYVPYIMPQEHGNIAGLRWLALRSAHGKNKGRGLLATADGMIEGKASHYSDLEQTKAFHTTDLKPSASTHLYLDVRQRGLGGASCGPDTLERYRVHSGQDYRLAYSLVPLAAGDDAGLMHRR